MTRLANFRLIKFEGVILIFGKLSHFSVDGICPKLFSTSGRWCLTLKTKLGYLPGTCTIFFFLQGGFLLRLHPRIKPTVLSLSFKFIGLYSAIQNPYRGPLYCSAPPLLFNPDPSRQSLRFASLSFPTPDIHVECVFFFCFFFVRWVPIGTPRLRLAGPLPYTSHLNS